MIEFLIEFLGAIMFQIIFFCVALPVGLVLSTPFVLVYGAYGAGSYAANVRAAYGVVVKFCGELSSLL